MKKRSAAPVTPIKPATSTADSFQNFAARLGYGAGNLTDASRYNIDYLSRNRFQLEAMYRSSWICGKAVDSVAEDMTKRGIEINSEAEPGAVDQLQEYWKTLKLWDAIADTIKWGRLYGGAVAVMLIDGQNLATPLRVETVKRDQFKGLCVLDRWQVQPSLDQLVQTLGPDLGMPAFYTVFGASRALSSAKIHYSRVIRIDGQDLPYWQAQAENLWGQSVIERLFDRLLAFDSTTQGAAQLVFKAHLRTYKVEGLRDIIAAGGQVLQGLTKQMDFMRLTQTNEGMTLMDTKDEFEAHSYTFSGLDNVLLQFAQQLSGALDIPLTRLFGQSPAGLNSTGESDMRNYYDGIAQQQERRLRTGVTVLLALTHLSLFGKPMPEGSGFTFRPLWQMSDLEKGQLAGTLTTAITSACTSSIVGRQTALKELRQQSRLTGIWTNISDEDIAAADNDVDTGGELGAPDDPFGDDGDGRTRDSGEWKESDHPREEDGKFTSGAGAAAGSGTGHSRESGSGPSGSEPHSEASEGSLPKQGFQLYSPNEEDQPLGLEQARANFAGEKHQRMLQESSEIDRSLGLRTRQFNTLGDTAGWGTENSIFNIVRNVEHETNRYSAAQKGLLHNQLAVIPFTAGKGGTDSLYRMKIAGKTAEELRQSLDEHGLQYRTFVPQEDGRVEVLIFDSESKLKREVGSFANTHQTRIKHYEGRGEFLGADTREQARAIYRQVIDEYERSRGIRSSLRQHDGGVRGHGVSDHRCARPAQGSQKVASASRAPKRGRVE